MSGPAYGEFIVKIMETLNNNGFPEKKVALPLESLYEAASKKGLSFNRVLDFLEEKGISHEKTTEKIIFAAATLPSSETQAENTQQGPFPNFDPQAFAGLNMSEMIAKAGEMMKSMDPQQLKSIQDLYQNMSEEDKKNILKKARDLGLF